MIKDGYMFQITKYFGRKVERKNRVFGVDKKYYIYGVKQTLTYFAVVF